MAQRAGRLGKSASGDLDVGKDSFPSLTEDGRGWGQDKFVSHTMKTEEEANLARIREEKSKADAGNPLEPLIASLLRGFVDDADLSAKLQELYTVFSSPCSTCHELLKFACPIWYLMGECADQSAVNYHVLDFWFFLSPELTLCFIHADDGHERRRVAELHRILHIH